MADTFRYRAFLSYSHSDEAVATRLHRALERYVLPRRVRKAHALPRRLIPIFRDVDELAAASGLTTRLQDALDQSQWLIVLCSPAAAQSKYVNAEIDYFVQKHGANRILCALVQGEPPECFPLAIKALVEEPLAADFRPGKDFELSKLKLIAALAGVGFTELRNRETQRRKRQQLIAALLLAAAGFSGIAYWDLFHREHVDYYASYVRRHGIWHGVDGFSSEVAGGRTASYRFTRAGRLRPPRRVDYVNGSGGCPKGGMDGPLGHPRTKGFGEQRMRYCAVAFDYREGGALARESWLNTAGRRLESLTYTEEGLAQFTQQGFASSEGGSGVLYIQATRDERGLDRRVQFLHSFGNPRANERDEFGWVLEYDGASRVIRRSVLDDRGEEIGPVTLIAYGDRGCTVETRQTDVAGQEQISRDGYSTRRAKCEARGNVARASFFLPDGTPALATVDVRGGENRASGFVAVVYVLDERGNVIESRYLDAQGQLTANRLGFAIERVAYDDRGNSIRTESLDASLQRVAVANEGVAIFETKYDDRNDPIEERSYGADGKPIARQYGPAILRRSYDDEKGNLQECGFDAQERPVVMRYGDCFHWSLDARGNPIGIDFMLDGKPYARPDTGVARTVLHRDDRGNLIGAAHYDADLKLAVNRLLGLAVSERKFDDYGNQVDLRRLDTQRRLMRGKNGAAIERARYDRSGNKVEETYFNEGQRPTHIVDGYFGYRARFDSRRRRTRVEYLDARGGLMAVPPLHVYGIEYEYDSFDSVASETYLDRDGKGAARLERRRNAYGWEVEKRFHDARGTLVSHPGSGCAIEAFEYDSFGQTIAERCLNLRAQPANRKDGGWAVKKIVPQVSGVNDETYFDAAGQPVKVAKQ